MARSLVCGLRASVSQCLRVFYVGPLSSSPHLSDVLSSILRSQRRPSESSCRRSRPPAQKRGRRRRPSNERRERLVGGASFATPPQQQTSKRCAAVSPLLTRVRVKAWVRDPALVFYPGSRGSRGPQRLFSLNPDTNAATPSPWRSLAWSGPTHYRAQRA